MYIRSICNIYALCYEICAALAKIIVSTSTNRRQKGLPEFTKDCGQWKPSLVALSFGEAHVLSDGHAVH